MADQEDENDPVVITEEERIAIEERKSARNAGDPGTAARGHRASVTKDGAVHGSGSGTGGGGTPEDFDWDAATGAEGDLEPRKPHPPGGQI